MSGIKKYAFFLVVQLLSLAAISQSCPVNMDFEEGNFSRWKCYYGQIDSGFGSNDINWFGFAQAPGRHEIINATDTGLDEFGLFPRLCPNGSGFSIKLGNKEIRAQAEGVSYIFDVPTGVSNYSIFFHYAVVLENPNHQTDQQPRFRARLINLEDDLPLECVNFDFTASSTLPGFEYSTINPTVLFKNWTPITLNLTRYAGKQLKLEFITTDCTLGGHFGYAYVDVSSACNGAISGSYICEGDPVSDLTAPFGFASYTWYSDITFTTVLSTSQVLNVNLSSLGSTFPVVVVPYPGFGCVDTVYATINSAPKPGAFAGIDRLVCSYESAQLGKPPDPGLQYTWTPSASLINHTVSNPYTKKGMTGVTAFIVTVTNPETACFSKDTVIVTPVLIDTSLQVFGDLKFCRLDPRNTSLQVMVAGESIQWHGNNQVIPGATALQYEPQPLGTTNYFASISRSGCIDTTRVITVTIPPYPSASFRPERKQQCVQIPVKFLNASKIPDNDSMSFVWKLQNGDEFSDKDLQYVFNDPGLQSIKLVATSAFGCKDSMTQKFNIVENCHVDIPTAFTPNNDGLNDVFRPSLHGIKTLRRFAVFDRWGNEVYRTRVIDEGWDGKHKGITLAGGLFVWILEYDSYERDNILLKGTVTLIR